MEQVMSYTDSLNTFEKMNLKRIVVIFLISTFMQLHLWHRMHKSRLQMMLQRLQRNWQILSGH